MIKQFCAWLLLCSTVVLLISGSAQAKTKGKKQTIPAEAKATFMIMPELPSDNLGGAHLGYFNLPLKAKTTKKVRIKVYNPTAHSIVINGQVKNATTNDNASVDYLGSNPINRQLLVQPGSELVTVPKQTKLAAGATKWLTIKVQPSTQLFKGQKAVAINLSATQVNQKSAIKNRYVYAVGLVLNGSKLTKTQFQKIQSPRIKTRFVKHKAAISVRVNNPDPSYLMATTIKAKLQNQKWGFITYEKIRRNREVAPNSSFYADIPLGGKRLVPGVYQMTLTVKSKQYQHTIHKYVKITKSDASYINRYNYEYLKNRNWILGGIGLVIIVGASIAGFRWKRKKDLNAKNS